MIDKYTTDKYHKQRLYSTIVIIWKNRIWADKITEYHISNEKFEGGVFQISCSLRKQTDVTI